MSSMNSTTLKLIIEKGPRNGETLEFNSKSTVRIGRVVRGNNLTIKDQGISSKHLTIEFNLSSGQWLITDLDSSNGTILNSSQLQPLIPIVVSDGDVIKVGELTLIRVRVCDVIDGGDNRRNTRRNCGGKIVRDLEDNLGSDIGGNLGVEFKDGLTLGDNVRVRVLEVNDGEKEVNNRKNPKRKGASKIGSKLGAENEDDFNLEEDKVGVLEVNDGDKEVELEKEVKKGRGRGRPKKVGVLEDNNGDSKIRSNFEVEHNESLNLGEGVTVSEVNDGEKVVELDKVIKKGRGRGRVKKVGVLEDNNGELKRNEGNEENVEGKVECGVSTRRTRSSRKEVEEFVSLDVLKPTRRTTRKTKDVDEVALRKVKEENEMDVGKCREVDNLGVVESKQTKGGRGGKKKVNVKVEFDESEDVGLGGEMGRNSSGMEGSEMVELSEKACEGLLDGAIMQNIVEEKVSGDEPIKESAQNNHVYDSTNVDLEVVQQVAEPVNDTSQHDKFEDDINRDLLEMEVEKPFSVPMNKTDNQNEVKVDAITNALDVVANRGLDNVGVVENKGKKGGRAGKKKVNVDAELESIEDIACLGDESEVRMNLSAMDGSEMVELREEKGKTDDVTLNNIVKEEVSRDEHKGGSLCDRGQPCFILSGDLLDMEVPEQVEGYQFANEQSCAGPPDDIVQHGEVEDVMNGDAPKMNLVAQVGGSLSIIKQPCLEVMKRNDQQSELTEKADSHVLEVEVPENGGGSSCVKLQPSVEPIEELTSQDEGLVSAVFESDFAMEDPIIRECDTREIPEESHSSYQSKETGRDSIQVPDLEKMTLGEWFDYMEVYLPDQIYNVTDQIIEDMRNRAKQFDEFMLEQQREKDRLLLAT